MARRHRSQGGVALLLFLFLIFGIATTVALSAWNSSSYVRAKEQKTQLSLQQAREAVIAWSTTRKNKGFPGQLPCSEDQTLIGQPTEGTAQSFCTQSTPVIGRIAWRSLGLDRPFDEDGEQLWYILSPGFRNPPPPGTVAVPTGQLILDGVPNSAAVIIIAPGPPLPGQNRTPPTQASPPQASDYLDVGNASGPNFVSTGPAGAFNDRLITITSQDLIQALKRRVLADMRGSSGNTAGLNRYYNDFGQYPWADTNGDGIADPGQTSGTVPYQDLANTNALNNLGWLNSWYSSVAYQRYSASKAQLSIGTLTLSVTP